MGRYTESNGSGKVGRISERENAEPRRICENVADSNATRQRGNERQEEIETDVDANAKSDNERRTREVPERQQVSLGGRSSQSGNSRTDWWTVEPNVGRVAHGISQRVDRLKGLGNAIIPQVATIIMKAIKDIDEAQ